MVAVPPVMDLLESVALDTRPNRFDMDLPRWTRALRGRLVQDRHTTVGSVIRALRDCPPAIDDADHWNAALVTMLTGLLQANQRVFMRHLHAADGYRSLLDLLRDDPVWQGLDLAAAESEEDLDRITAQAVAVILLTA